MKKLIGLIFALSLLLILTVSASTTEESFNTLTETSKTVHATYISASEEKTVYSIDIIWGDLQFEYRDASNGTWNPGTLNYDNTTPAGWYPKTEATNAVIGSNQVVISNRSNAGINCAASFALNPEYSDTFEKVKGTFDCASFKLPSAAENNTEQTQTISLFLSGTPKILDFTSPTPLGTITLVFDAAS